MESQIFNPPISKAALTKQSCRLHLKVMRSSISLARRQDATFSAHQTLWNACEGSKCILSYASFGSELSLDSLNARLAQEGRLVLPKIVEGGLSLFLVTDLDDLECNSWGIREPNPTRAPSIEPGMIDFVFVPGLGFDPETKHRLGYGKGFYDRLLTPFPHLPAWGIGFSEQAFHLLPSETHDRPLSALCLF